MCLTVIAYVFIQGKYEEAIPVSKELVAILKRDLGSDHPNVALGLNNLAMSLRLMVCFSFCKTLHFCLLNFKKISAQGKYEEALAMYKEALAIDKKALGDDHPAVATDLNNLAGCLKSVVYKIISISHYFISVVL